METFLRGNNFASDVKYKISTAVGLIVFLCYREKCMSQLIHSRVDKHRHRASLEPVNRAVLGWREVRLIHNKTTKGHIHTHTPKTSPRSHHPWSTSKALCSASSSWAHKPAQTKEKSQEQSLHPVLVDFLLSGLGVSSWRGWELCHFFIASLCWCVRPQTVLVLLEKCYQKSSSISCFEDELLPFPPLNDGDCFRRCLSDLGIWPLKSGEITVHIHISGQEDLFSILSWDPKIG